MERHVSAFPAVFEQLRTSRGMSIEDVGLEIKARYGRSKKRPRGLSLSTLQKVASGAQPPNIGLMRAVAGVLDTSPMEFAEYRLAVARYALNEEVVGLDDALEALEAVSLQLDLDAAVRAAEALDADDA